MPETQDAYQVVNMAGGVLAIFTQAGDAEAWLAARGARLEPQTGVWLEFDEDGDVDAEYEVRPVVLNDQEMTLDEAATRYGVQHDTLRRAVFDGRLMARKSGERVWLVTHAQMRKYLVTRGPRAARRLR
jgi:excisionase family DNA binding protein